MLENTVAYRLFHYPYRCIIPYHFTCNIDMINEVGDIVSGDENIDRGHFTRPCELYLTPIAMAIYYGDGAPIQLVNWVDAATIYRDVVAHLENWIYVIQNFHNVDAPPLEELLLLDRFASVLHSMAHHAQQLIQPVVKENELMKFIKKQPTQAVQSPPAFKPYQSLSPTLTRLLWVPT